MHDAHHNRRIPDTKRGERWSAPYLRCSPRTVIETWALECVFYNKYSGCCDMAKVLCILCTGSVVHIHQTLYEHIRTTSSCRLLFVLRTDMSILLDSVIQHGIDGAHLYDGWLSPGAKSPSNVTMENMFLYRKPNSNHRKGPGACCQLNSCEMPCKLVLPSHKISIYEDVLTPHLHRLPHTCNGKTLFFRYWRNFLQQQGIVTVHSYAHYNATYKRREKRWSSLKWVVQV